MAGIARQIIALRAITALWGIHLTGVERRLGQWNVPAPAATTPSLLESSGLGSRLMQIAWTTWNGCDGLAASSARRVVIREDGGLGTAGSCVLDAVAARSVMAGTIFDRTGPPLTVWFSVCWHFATGKDGISALSLKRVLEIGSYQTAWAILHRLRSVPIRPDRERLAGRWRWTKLTSEAKSGLSGGRPTGRSEAI